MKICENGNIREMTNEEIAAFEATQRETENTPQQKTPEERITELEEALNLLLSGATE